MLHLRADAIDQAGYDLAPPRPHPGGGTVFEMVLAVPGVQAYPELGFNELVTEDALQGSWIDAVCGAPIIDVDGLHWKGTDVASIPGARIGTGLEARWDPRQKAVIGSAVIDVQRGLDKIAKGVTGVSPRYRPAVHRADGIHNGRKYQSVQTARFADPGFHILVTGKPRGGVTRFRADALGGMMNLKEVLLGLFDEAGNLRADALGDDATPAERIAVAMGNALAKVTGERDAALANARALQVRADAVPTIAPFKDAMDLAARLGVEVKPEDTLDELQARLVAKVGVRADSTATRGAVIATMLLTAAASPVTPEAENEPKAHIGASRRPVPTSKQTGGL